MKSGDIHMFTPFLGQPNLLKVTQARADQVQTWVNRQHVEIAQPNPGRGKSRLYSELDAMKIGVMVRLAAFGISVVRAAEFAAYVDRRYRENKPIPWDEFTKISFISQMRPDHSFVVSQGAPHMNLGISSGDTEHMRIATFTEWFRGVAPSRRDGSGEIVPEARDRLAAAGIHAEPFLFFPIGEVVNGIRAQVSAMRMAEEMQV
ncbi:MAG: hypothetical protein RIG84_00280 [Roseovarius sp.]